MRWVVSIIIGLAIWLVVIFVIVGTMSWAAGRPGSLEKGVMTRVKYWRVGGKDVSNPTPDTQDTVKEGAEHFQHHCQICHGLDGQNTGVPIATRTLPPAADLASPRVQKYTDGQLKWIIDNGIRFSGMPRWKGTSISTDQRVAALAMPSFQIGGEARNHLKNSFNSPSSCSMGLPTCREGAPR